MTGTQSYFVCAFVGVTKIERISSYLRTCYERVITSHKKHGRLTTQHRRTLFSTEKKQKSGGGAQLMVGLPVLSGALKTPLRAVELQPLGAGCNSTFLVEGANPVTSASCVHQSLGTLPCHRPVRHQRKKKKPWKCQHHKGKLWIPLARYH